MTLELDLGFDSLSRVELLGLAEAEIGTSVDEERTARIFTLGELIEALTESPRATKGGPKPVPQNAALSASGPQSQTQWKELLDIRPSDPLNKHYIHSSRTLLNPTMFVLMRALQGLSKIGFSLSHSGVEKLPRSLPFVLCPNHESFLDGPLLISTLPR